MALTQVPPALLTSTTGTGSTVVLSASPTFTGTITTPGVTFSDASSQTAAASPYVLKNRIINGDMRIDQRNAGAEKNPAVTDTYYVDRWAVASGAASKFKIQQDAGAVTPPTGFNDYLGCTSLSAYTAGASEQFGIYQPIEGYNVADLAFGTASAKTITISFWVRSSLTGTFGGSVRNSAANRSYVFSYTISVANTWEQKSVTITGDTSGTWFVTNGVGMYVFFSIGSGSTVSGTAGSWAAANYVSATGATSVVGTNGATFYITGVQLEQNTSATPFERRLIGTELELCQRYFEKSYNQATSIASATQTGMILMPNVLNFSSSAYTQAIYYKVNKRATPTVTPYAYNGTSGQWNTGVIGVNEQLGNATIDASSESKFGLVIAYTVTPNCAYGQFAASAEL
jgi:hypothetical protein